MEDSFSVRVGKAFGSLADLSPASVSSSSSSLWSLRGDEIERREWNRDKASPEPELRIRPCKGDFSGDELDLDDDVEEEEKLQLVKPKPKAMAMPMPDDYNEEQWEIKSSIGLDSTLDHEEEEDEFDKVAVCTENRLYMKDVNDYPIDIDSQFEVPNLVKDFDRDPRANHLAAKIRLKQDAEAGAAQVRLQEEDEDAEAARKIDSLQVSDEFVASEDVINPKSILKRKTDETSKTQKRVRFDAECKDGCDEEHDGSKDVPAKSDDFTSAVPDYIRNPSRYTHYTFDSSTDMNEEANMQAYMDFRNLMPKSDTMESKVPRDFLSKPVMFIPKKKSTDATMIDGEFERPVGAGKEVGARIVMPISIAAMDNEDNDVCAMDEDEPETGRASSQRTGRQFRTRTSLELDE